MQTAVRGRQSTLVSAVVMQSTKLALMHHAASFSEQANTTFGESICSELSLLRLTMLSIMLTVPVHSLCALI